MDRLYESPEVVWRSLDIAPWPQREASDCLIVPTWSMVMDQRQQFWQLGRTWPLRGEQRRRGGQCDCEDGADLRRNRLRRAPGAGG